MIVAHKDLQVIEILKNGIVDTDDVETLRPIPSEPEPPPISEGKIDSTTVGSSENDATKSGPIKPPAAADLNNDNALSKKNNTVFSAITNVRLNLILILSLADMKWKQYFPLLPLPASK